jgi:hypothetical protein
MNRRVLIIPKIRVLGSHVPRAELAFNDIPMSLMVRVAPNSASVGEANLGCSRTQA